MLADDLLSERAGFTMVLNTQETTNEAMPTPPTDIFKIVKYKTALDDMSAYFSQLKMTENEKRPAIIWFMGGFTTNSPGDYLWTDTEADNEQSARVYRNYGIVMMFPTLRGGTKLNPGVVEQFYGEVNDVISAGKYLNHIDPERVYLGGHSTGGTLALLVAEATGIFAGVISLGPTSDHYGKNRANFARTDEEIRLRSPKNFLSYISKPTYIVEGEFAGAGRLKGIQDYDAVKPNSHIQTTLVTGANHFNVIHSVNILFAKAIAEAKGSVLSIDMKTQVKPAYVTYIRKVQETNDLQILTDLRSQGLLLEGNKRVQSTFYSRDKEHLSTVVSQAKALGMSVTEITQEKSKDGSSYFGSTFSKVIDIASLPRLFELSTAFKGIADNNELYYGYWTITGK